MAIDYDRIKSNIKTMIDKGAPESDIDAYVSSEGTTAEALRNASEPTPAPTPATASEAPAQDTLPVPTEASPTSTPVEHTFGGDFNEAIQNQGGWGLSDETKHLLGGDGAGKDLPAFLSVLDPVTKLPAAVADLAYRGLQGAGAAAEAGLKQLGEPGRQVAGALEALPLAGGEAGALAGGLSMGERVKAIQSVFDKGGKAEDVIKAADEAGLSVKPEDVQKIIDYRDAGGKGATVAEPVQPLRPALRDTEGKVYTGNVGEGHVHVFEQNPDIDWGGTPEDDGFVTHDNKYLTRKEATDYVNKQGITVKPTFEGAPLDSHDYNTAMQDAQPAAPTLSHDEVVAKMTDALNNAGKLNKDQAALYRDERSQRLKAVLNARQGTSGEAGFRNELAQLKGEYGKVQAEPIRDQFTQEHIDGLFDSLRDSRSLSTFDQLNARSGLGKLLDGKVPTPKEVDLLGRVFPPDFVKAAMKNRTGGEKAMQVLGDAINLPRSMMSTLDLSAPFRQGLFLSGRKEFWNSFGSMFKQFGSEKAFNAVREDIQGRQTYPLMEQAGLSLSDVGHSMTDREEAFMSKWPEKVPVFGQLHKASERAYTGFLNKVRADTFDTLVKKSYDAGISFNKDPKALRDIGRFVNAATGRGDLGHFAQAGPVLNGLFFSPRLIASRVNLLNPAYYADLSPVVRKEAVKSLLSLGAIASTVGGLAHAAGAQVELDPRSSDFLKAKVGNTHFDYLGGFGQYLTLGARLATNQTKSTTTGEIKNLGEKFGSPTRFDTSINFARNKLSPVASFVADYLKGTDGSGQKFDAKSEAAQRFVPLFLQDVQSLATDPNSAGLAAAVPGVFGVGIQNYDPNIRPNLPKRVQDNVKTMEKKGASQGEIKMYLDTEKGAKS